MFTQSSFLRGSVTIFQFSGDPDDRAGLRRDPGELSLIHILFDGEGHLIKVIDNLLYPTDVTADDHYIYIAEREGRISIYNYDLQLTAQIGYWLSSIIPHSICLLYTSRCV